MRTLVCLLVLCGCNAASLPPPARALGYASADHHAQERVDAECRLGDGGVSFARCPVKDEIMNQLRTAQEACK